jgi:transcriptional regulator with XRE-family HTH domain
MPEILAARFALCLYWSFANVTVTRNYSRNVNQSITNFADAKTFGQRLRWLRRFKELTLQKFASRIGCNAGYLSHLENGKAKNPSERFIVSIVVNFRVSGQWLRAGEGDPFWEAAKDSQTRKSLPDWSEKRLQRIMAVLDELPDALAIEAVLRCLLRGKTLAEVQSLFGEIRGVPNLPVTARLFWDHVYVLCQVDKLPGGSPEKEFDSVTVVSNTEGVKFKISETQKLRDDLKRATAKPGMKAALARFMKVDPPRVSEWLAGQEPGGEYALKLRTWADEQLGHKSKK